MFDKLYKDGNKFDDDFAMRNPKEDGSLGSSLSTMPDSTPHLETTARPPAPRSDNDTDPFLQTDPTTTTCTVLQSDVAAFPSRIPPTNNNVTDDQNTFDMIFPNYKSNDINNTINTTTTTTAYTNYTATTTNHNNHSNHNNSINQNNNRTITPNKPRSLEEKHALVFLWFIRISIYASSFASGALLQSLPAGRRQGPAQRCIACLQRNHKP
jgi:hypothetical protein